MNKRKKIVYREKKYNIDTIIVNTMQVVGRIGIHAPMNFSVQSAYRGQALKAFYAR